MYSPAPRANHITVPATPASNPSDICEATTAPRCRTVTTAPSTGTSTGPRPGTATVNRKLSAPTAITAKTKSHLITHQESHRMVSQ